MIADIREYNKAEAYRLLRDENLSIHLKGAAALGLIHCYYERAIEHLYQNDELSEMLGENTPSLKEYAEHWLWSNGSILAQNVREWLEANLSITPDESPYLQKGCSSYQYPSETKNAD